MAIFRKKKIADLSPISLAILRKRTRLLVIDDDQNSFPLELFRKEGYAIEQWEKVDNLTKLEEGYYDIIIYN